MDGAKYALMVRKLLINRTPSTWLVDSGGYPGTRQTFILLHIFQKFNLHRQFILQEIMLQIWSGRICGVDIHISERRDSGQHSWSRLLSVLCLHKHDKADLAAKGLMPVCSDIYTDFCHFHELKCKGKVKIVSYRRKC